MKRILVYFLFILAFINSACLPTINDEELLLVNAEIRENEKNKVYLVFNKNIKDNLPQETTGFYIFENTTYANILNITKDDTPNILVLTLSNEINITQDITISYSGTANISSTDGAVLDGFYQKIINLILSDDTTPPVPGNNGSITPIEITKYSASISWYKATDDKLNQKLIQYKVIKSDINNISTVSNAEINGKIIKNWTENISNITISNLQPGLEYYYNIIVKDTNDNKSIYKTKYIKTPNTWVTVGTNDFASATKYKIDFYNNQPYIAFTDKDYGNKLSVMKYNGFNWVYIGTPGFSEDSADILSLTVDKGIPYVLYKNSFAYELKPVVKKFNGTSWEYVGNPGFSTNSIHYASDSVIKIIDNRPYAAITVADIQKISNYDVTFRRLKLYRYDNGNWNNVYTNNIGPGTYNIRKILLISTNNIYYYFNYLYYDQIINFNGTKSSNIPISFGRISDLIYKNGKLSAIHNTPGEDITRSYLDYNGTSWDLKMYLNFRFINISSTSANDTPYIIASDEDYGNKASVLRLEGNTFQFLSGRGISKNATTQNEINIIDGIPYISFIDEVTGKITVMKYD